MILFQSLAVADAVYEVQWFSLLPKTRLALLLVMLRSQRPINLQTRFFKANLVTFSSVIHITIEHSKRFYCHILILQIFSTAGSYITLLQTVH